MKTYSSKSDAVNVEINHLVPSPQSIPENAEDRSKFRDVEKQITDYIASHNNAGFIPYVMPGGVYLAEKNENGSITPTPYRLWCRDCINGSKHNAEQIVERLSLLCEGLQFKKTDQSYRDTHPTFEAWLESFMGTDDCGEYVEVSGGSYSGASDVMVGITFVGEYLPERDEYKCPVQPYLPSLGEDEIVTARKLNAEEHQFFDEYNKDLAEVWPAFIHAGYILHLIKECQLYRDTHTSFAAYCKDRLKMEQL